MNEGTLGIDTRDPFIYKSPEDFPRENPHWYPASAHLIPVDTHWTQSGSEFHCKSVHCWDWLTRGSFSSGSQRMAFKQHCLSKLITVQAVPCKPSNWNNRLHSINMLLSTITVNQRKAVVTTGIKTFLIKTITIGTKANFFVSTYFLMIAVC